MNNKFAWYDSKDLPSQMVQGALGLLPGWKRLEHASHFIVLDSFIQHIRNKVSSIADIGCGAGSFLSHVSGLAKHIVAIEPTKRYHSSLRKSGYAVFSYVSDALKKFQEGVDIAFAFQVIEHVQNPHEFLTEISSLLKPGGQLIIVTPNRDDILLKLLPEEFSPFYYG